MKEPLTSRIQMLEYGIMKPYSNISCFSTTRSCRLARNGRAYCRKDTAGNEGALWYRRQGCDTCIGPSISLESFEVAGICTYQQHEDLFSARRLGIKSGRILSGIMLV